MFVQSHRDMVESRFTFRAVYLRSMLFSLSTLQALGYVLIVSEMATQKHFSSWQKYYYYFLGTGKWSLDAGQLPYGQGCSCPLQEQQ